MAALAVGLSGTGAGAAPSSGRDDRSDPPGAVVVTDPEDGHVTTIAARPGRALTPPTAADAASVARGFLAAHGRTFGVEEPAAELTIDRRIDTLTGSSIRFRQEHDGIPVLGAEISVAVRADGGVTSSSGDVSPSVADSGLDLAPRVTADAAAAEALAATARATGLASAELTVADPELWIYDPSLLGASGLPMPQLVWRTSVRTVMGDVDRFVLVDAARGGISLEFDQVASARDRRVCDNANDHTAPLACGAPAVTEGGDPSSTHADVQAAYAHSGATYDFFANVLGRDSIDGAGMPIVSTVRYCPNAVSCPYQNAFWNGAQMVYGASYASALDVVAHELMHGVTSYTSGLLYFGESGAINESMSDVFGQIVQLANLPGGDPDQTAWLLGEDLPIGAIRSMSDPTDFGDPDRMTSPHYVASPVDHYGVHANSGVGNKTAYLIAMGGTFNGVTVGAGIGITATAKIFYQAATAILGPVSDYAELGVALQQACASLVGSGVSAGDCTVVANAIAATELATPPTSDSIDLREDELCPGSTPGTVAFSDDIDTGTASWVTAGATHTGANLPSAAWQYVRLLSTANGLWGPDVSIASSSYVRTALGVQVPASGTTYLTFDHAFDFDHEVDGSGLPDAFYDGGRVMYSTTGLNGTYHDLAGLTGANPVNGYNHVLDTYGGNNNPAAGQWAFAGESPGIQTSRFDISALAGQTVHVQFSVMTDNSIGSVGWLIDTVDVHQCGSGGPVPTTAPATTAPATTAPTTTAPSTVPSTTPPDVPSPGSGGLTAASPCRLFDTRPAPLTVGPRSTPLTGGQVLDAAVWGTNGACVIPTDASAVVLNITVTGARDGGFLTVYPCDSPRPNASSLNYAAGQTVGNSVTARLSATGRLCFFALGTTDVVVDVNGWFSGSATYAPLVPARVLDTRPGFGTIDGDAAGVGMPGAGSVVALQIGGRAGVPLGASAAAFNLTVTGGRDGGFVTAFPCDAARPNASNLNHEAAQTVGNSVIAKLAANGTVCLFTYGATHLVVDVSGYVPAGAGYAPIAPVRALDTRPGFTTADGVAAGIGIRSAGSVLALSIGGRLGVPADAEAVALNMTVTGSTTAGYVTVFPCDAPRPTASNLNHAAGQTAGNSVIAKLAADGSVCLFVYGGTHVIVDVNGWFGS